MNAWTSRLHTWCRKKKLIIPTSHDRILVFFFTELQFQLYSKILNNILTKTDHVTSLSIHLINLLLHHSCWLIGELMIARGVLLECLFKRWVGNKDVIYCICMAFFYKYVPNSSWSIFFFWFAKAIPIPENIN